jgi:uncharacterized protein (TIGR04222 family)
VNPFDLQGPEFLFVYLMYGGLTLLGLVLLRRRRESGPAAKLDLTHPYLVAYLRAGRDEAVRVALVSLTDRKLVVPGEPHWRAADDADDAIVHPLERALLRRFAGEGDAPDPERWDPAVERACDQLHRELQRLGLMPDDAMDRARERRAVAAIALLAIPAAIKVALALQRGRHNVAILIILAVAFAAGAWLLRGGRITWRGRRLLADLRVLFSGLRQRADRPASGGEVALLAGVFGAAVLPLAVFPHGEVLAGRSEPGGRGCSASVSSCGSTCSSGGGDGGGGGGCGGCGSS